MGTMRLGHARIFYSIETMIGKEGWDTIYDGIDNGENSLPGMNA